MATVKDSVIAFIKTLPDDITMEDLMYNLYAKQKILQAKRQLAENNVKTHEEIESLARQWHL